MSKREAVTFVDACLAGDALALDIDDWVDRWHDDDVPDPTLSLDEFLGFSSEEGQLWAEKPASLDFILNAHRHGVPVTEVVTQYEQADYTLAARSASDTSAALDVFNWLVAQNRIRV